MKFPKKFVFLLGAASGICWGTYGMFSHTLSDFGLEQGTISMIVPMSYAIFFFVLVCKDGIGNLKVAKKLVPFIILFGFFSACFNFCTVRGYDYLPIGIVSTIIYCNLFLLMLFSRILFKVPLTKRKLAAAALAVIGVGLLLNIVTLEFSFSVAGLCFALGAMVAWAMAVTTEKYLLEKGVNANAVMVYNGIFAVSFLCLNHSPVKTVMNVADVIVSSGGAVLFPLIFFAVFTSMMSYFFYIRGLQRLETAYVQLGFVLDPLTSTLLGFVIFGQALMPLQIVGILLVVFVVAWVQWSELKENKKTALKE